MLYRNVRKNIYHTPFILTVCRPLRLALLIYGLAMMHLKASSLRGWGSTAPVQALYSQFMLRLLFVHRLILFRPSASRPVLIFVAIIAIPFKQNLNGRDLILAKSKLVQGKA